jgi:uncharacterized membrane protein
MNSRHERDVSMDVVRGAVMVLMALDHARDFFFDSARDPTDLLHTTWVLFFTRWITHFCAPVFVLLAGVSAWMSQRSRTPGEASLLLLKRGLWLVLLELTVVRVGWLFDLTWRFTFVQVIWAIGWSMVALSVLSLAGRRVAFATGLALIVGHNLFDGVHAESLGTTAWAWRILHEGGTLVPLEGHRVYVAYPLVPWVGVMAVGYAMGPWVTRSIEVRRKGLLSVGIALTVLFVALRGYNHYGDPHPWNHSPRPGFVLLSFLNCDKYPPSLDYLLMTLGPALVLWGMAVGRTLRVWRWLGVFGRVPLFYYVLHLPLLHAMAGAWVYARGGRAAVELAVHSRHGANSSLWVAYGAWLMALAVLWPACRWFGTVKAQHPHAWWTHYV